MKRAFTLAVIGIGLMALTVSAMSVGNLLFGLTPNQSTKELEYRRSLSEALAVQYSKLAEEGDSITIKFALRMLVERNDDIISAGLRRSDGIILAKAGDHEGEWVQPPDEQSTLNHIQVPIFSGDAPWGILQVTFRGLRGTGLWGALTHPWSQFVAFVAILGFLGHLLFIKRTLRQLDPSAVIPPRVKAAFEVLAEGIVLLDTNGYIVLANAAFAERVGLEGTTLLGHSLSELAWKSPEGETAGDACPWTLAMTEKMPQEAERLTFSSPTGEVRNFVVKSAPIMNEAGVVQGALVSFSDVTGLDHTHARLTEVAMALETSRAEVVSRNEELAQLAMRDTLTGCLNRRAFFAKAETAFAAARLEGAELSCIMADIDRFKSINDRYGHVVGDEVIHWVARTLNAGLRPTDFLGRYGGEEFCILLPERGAMEAAKVAERLRQRIETESGAAIRAIAGIRITVSLGVSTAAFGAPDLSKLIDQADQALYAAKKNGRNCGMMWDQAGQAQELSNGTLPLPPQHSSLSMP